MKVNREVWENNIKFWEKNLFYPKEDLFIKWLLKFGRAKDRILDQGTGIGQYAITAYRNGFRKIEGLDFSENLLKIARKNAKKYSYKIKFVLGDIRKMPFKDNTFDIVISGGIIEHVPQTGVCLSELNRILKKEGLLFIHIPHKISIFTLLKLIQKSLFIWKVGYEKSFTKKYFSNLLVKSGFEIKDIYLKDYRPGKHPFIGKIIQIIDHPLYKRGFGGHHLFFLCKKIN